MEAVATGDLRIWHAFIGTPGSNNDLNVLDRSPLPVQFWQGPISTVQFECNGNTYEGGYLLCDGIYPNFPIFVKTISKPQTEKLSHFAKCQEAVRKDVERCFGVLRKRFAILTSGARLRDVEMIKIVWRAAIILHNMIIENEKSRTDLEDIFQPSHGPINFCETAISHLTSIWDGVLTYKILLAIFRCSLI